MKKKWASCVLSVIVLLAAVGCKTNSAVNSEQPQRMQSPPVARPGLLADDQVPYTAEIVAERLDVPWALDFAPDGRLFFTERPGTVRVIQQGRLLPRPVITFPAPFVSEGEGGLLGIAVDPDFAVNHYLYVYHTYREQENVYNRVVRLKEDNNRASLDKVLLDRIPGGLIHNGGRLKIGPDRRLYITTGDAGVPERAQVLASLAGKILRLNLDGTIPADNPFRHSPVYSWGHRNPQGIAWSPQGSMYSSEHGAFAHDEINLIEPGANYGWPMIQGDQQASGMRAPNLHSGETTWAPSGMAFVATGPWRDQLFVANLRGEQILKIAFQPANPRSIQAVEAFYRNKYGRIRDVVQGRDGFLYLLTNNRDGRGEPRPGDDAIIRLRPSGF
jgi:glucose/arabinose dehydrogenase